MERIELYFCHNGAGCAWPMEAYDPSDLPGEDHAAIQERFYRDARRDGMGEDKAREAAHQFYFHWLTRKWRTRDIPRGDHARAYYSVRAYARRSCWHGFTGERRQARGKRIPRGSDGRPVRMSVKAVGEEELASRERARQRAYYTPAMVAEAIERIGRSPLLGRKAYRLARKIGLRGVRELVLEACGFAAE